MSEEIKQPENQTYDTFIDDMKDSILQKLKVDELEGFKKEIDSEILMRKCTKERYSKYQIEIEKIKTKFSADKKLEIEKYKKELEVNKSKLRAKFIKDDSVFDEEEEEEEDEEDVPKPKRGRPKKKS